MFFPQTKMNHFPESFEDFLMHPNYNSRDCMNYTSFDSIENIYFKNDWFEICKFTSAIIH